MRWPIYFTCIIGLSLSPRYIPGTQLINRFLSSPTPNLIHFNPSISIRPYLVPSNPKMCTHTTYFDIAVNLSDPMYNGVYHGKQKHPQDIQNVIERSKQIGMKYMISLGGNLEDSIQILELSKQYSKKNEIKLFTTVGVHPTRCQEFINHNEEIYLTQLKHLINENKGNVIAVGEIGLDYDRTQFCPIDIQKRYFSKQLEMAYEVGLPVIFHMREAFDDFMDILRSNFNKYGPIKGVVHSFTGKLEEAKQIVEIGLFLGLNGCSLKTNENLKCVEQIPIDRILLETDAPYCGIRPTHSSFSYISSSYNENPVKPEKWCPEKCVKGRNEPYHIKYIAEVIYKLKGSPGDFSGFCQRISKNTQDFFFLNSKYEK